MLTAFQNHPRLTDVTTEKLKEFHMNVFSVCVKKNTEQIQNEDIHDGCSR